MRTTASRATLRGVSPVPWYRVRGNPVRREGREGVDERRGGVAGALMAEDAI